MIPVTELKVNSGLPKEFLDVLPEYCDDCGSPNEINETLTILRCSNNFCIAKVTHRLVALLTDLGIKGMGESKCRQFLENFGTTNPYAILVYEPDVDGPLFEGCSMDFSYNIFDQLNQKRSMMLWEYLKIGNLPGIRDISRHLLSNYDSLEEFYEDLEEGGIEFVQEQLSIGGSGENEVLSVKAVEVYNTLMLYKHELFEAIDYVDIKSVNVRVLNICISTAVGEPYKSKTDFVDQMNKLYGHKVHLNYLSAVTKDCDYLIWSKRGSPTSKVKKAEKYGIPIMTGSEFAEMLENL